MLGAALGTRRSVAAVDIGRARTTQRTRRGPCRSPCRSRSGQQHRPRAASKDPAAHDERHTPSTRASDSDFGYDIYPNADRFYSAPLPHHRPLYLRARRPRAPRIHRRRQRGDGTQFNAVGPLIRILIEDDDRRRAAADDPHPGAAAAWRRLGALDGPLAPRAAHRIDGISLGLRGASTSGCVEMASKKSRSVYFRTRTRRPTAPRRGARRAASASPRCSRCARWPAPRGGRPSRPCSRQSGNLGPASEVRFESLNKSLDLE